MALSGAARLFARRRYWWRKYQARNEPSRLVFLEEGWAKTKIAPLRGWRADDFQLSAAATLLTLGPGEALNPFEVREHVAPAPARKAWGLPAVEGARVAPRLKIMVLLEPTMIASGCCSTACLRSSAPDGSRHRSRRGCCARPPHRRCDRAGSARQPPAAGR